MEKKHKAESGPSALLQIPPRQPSPSPTRQSEEGDTFKLTHSHLQRLKNYAMTQEKKEKEAFYNKIPFFYMPCDVPTIQTSIVNHIEFTLAKNRFNFE